LADFELDDGDCVFVFEGVDLDFLVGVMTGLISSSSSAKSDPDSEYSRLTTIARLGEYGGRFNSVEESGVGKISSAMPQSASLPGDHSLTTRPFCRVHSYATARNDINQRDLQYLEILSASS